MVSVIVPTYNAVQHINTLLESLSKQTIEHELIIIDSTSSDGTAEIVKSSRAQFYQIPPSEFNHGKTRNLGIHLAKYDTIIFLTQDALPADGRCLEHLISPLTNIDNCVMSYGRQLPYPNASQLSQFARITNYPALSRVKSIKDIDELGIKTCHSSNSFAAYSKQALLDIGGFPTDTILGEDVSVAARFILKGYSLAYCAEAQVYHSHDYTLVEEFKRYFDIGVFHQQQREVLHHFTRAEAEGFKYVKQEWNYLLSRKMSRLIPEQIIRTSLKYAGYKLGRWHDHLPKGVKTYLSMHHRFWLTL